MKKIFLSIFLVFNFCFVLFSQEDNYTDSHVLKLKETYGGIVVNTSSWGINFRNGKHKTGMRKRVWEFEVVGLKSSKEKKYNPNYDNSKSYVYGKLNYLYLLHAGKGIQRILNHKPFWGGVELRLCGFAGASIGITKPVYLYILNVSKYPYEGYTLTEERYDPSKHDMDNIYGRAPFLTGIEKTKFHPGLYGKLGLNFEYGPNDRTVKAIEVGAVVDAFLKPIPIMAFEKSKNIFLSLYLSLNFGGRYN